MKKLLDRKIDLSYFKQCYNERLAKLQVQQQEFCREMQRFLNAEAFIDEIKNKLWWENLLCLLKDWGRCIV